MKESRAILVVDDDDDIRATLQDVLSGEGYPVIVAADGREALDKLRAHRVGLVILDLMMPGMNGWDFRAEQTNDQQLAQIPVVVLSGAGLPQKTLPPEAAAYLSKPVDIDDLLDAVERCYASA